MREIKRHCAELRRWPLRGQQRPEFGANVRSFPVGPIIVFYQLSEDERNAVVVSIIDGRRDLGTVFFSPLVQVA